MSLELVDANVVIVARMFNPSIISQHWLIENHILEATDIQPGFVFTDQFAQVSTPSFALAVLPQRLQFAPTVPEEQQQGLIVDKVGSIIGRLPHTPFIAGGLNITWHLTPEQTDIGTLTRRLFYRDDNPLYQTFNQNNPRFGGYFSQDLLGCRFKLDVKPVEVVGQDRREWEVLQLAFNCHLDLAEVQNPVDLIDGMLHRWDEAKALSAQIADHAVQQDTQ